MDVKGAKLLTARIAEEQWRRAPSVRRGEQPRDDPDAAHVEAIGDDYRLYALPANAGEDAPRRVKKVLVDGHWRLEGADDVDADAAA